VFFVCAIDNRRTADFSDLLSMSVVGPAADLLTADHILNEHDAPVETQRQLVKQLYVLQ